MIISYVWQPALLYLSPACILSTWIVALIQGQVTQVWTYSSELNIPKETNQKSKALGSESATETMNKGKENRSSARLRSLRSSPRKNATINE